jgi:hypothetical protein
MRPRIICHVLSSVDGKIDGAALRAVIGKGEYEITGRKLEGDPWICGRTTMQHFAEHDPFVSVSKKPAGPQPVYVRGGPRRMPSRWTPWATLPSWPCVLSLPSS